MGRAEEGKAGEGHREGLPRRTPFQRRYVAAPALVALSPHRGGWVGGWVGERGKEVLNVSLHQLQSIHGSTSTALRSTPERFRMFTRLDWGAGVARHDLPKATVVYFAVKKCRTRVGGATVRCRRLVARVLS